MGNKYQITDAEWLIMKAIWANESMTANEIIEILTVKTNWAPRTIKTMLGRLVTKKVLGYTKEGRSYRYHPLISASATIDDENKSFIKKVYNGDFSSLLSSFVEQNEFTEEEINRFKSILEGKRS